MRARRRRPADAPLADTFVTAGRPLQVRIRARPPELANVGPALAGTLVTSASPYGYALISDLVLPVVLADPDRGAAAPGEAVEARLGRRSAR